MIVGGRTRVFALLGDPVAHSLSPRMQNAAFTVLGLDAIYVTLRCDATRVGDLMRVLVEAGGGGNVTVPHKAAAAAAADRMEGSPAGACNTFWGEAGALIATNTDPVGITAALDGLEGDGANWLVVGTGGSARAVAEAARARGARLAVRSRTRARARAFCGEVGADASLGAEECEVIINATPLGLGSNDPIPITPFETPRARWVLDLVYARGGTPFVEVYRERGIAAVDGREVLIAQGAAAFERWFPGVAAPVEVMRAAVRAELG